PRTGLAAVECAAHRLRIATMTVVRNHHVQITGFADTDRSRCATTLFPTSSSANEQLHRIGIEAPTWSEPALGPPLRTCHPGRTGHANRIAQRAGDARRAREHAHHRDGGPDDCRWLA